MEEALDGGRGMGLGWEVDALDGGRVWELIVEHNSGATVGLCTVNVLLSVALASTSD